MSGIVVYNYRTGNFLLLCTRLILPIRLFKVESGINEGDILYHKFVEKDPVEAAKAKAKVHYVCECMQCYVM